MVFGRPGKNIFSKGKGGLESVCLNDVESVLGNSSIGLEATVD
jgi:hypothetical protein